MLAMRMMKRDFVITAVDTWLVPIKVRHVPFYSLPQIGKNRLSLLKSYDSILYTIILDQLLIHNASIRRKKPKS